MPRPTQCRRVCQSPGATLFKPAGFPASALDEIVLAVDEFEALRLADLEGLYHAQAAERMGVSRRTFGRIIESARRKVARTLTEGLVLRIEGGKVEMAETRSFVCDDCHCSWQLPPGARRPTGCPECQGKRVFRHGRGRAGSAAQLAGDRTPAGSPPKVTARRKCQG
jgi:predicted DNA-binding protein (UPF0251 family)